MKAFTMLISLYHRDLPMITLFHLLTISIK